MTFVRTFSEEAIAQLKKEPLFQKLYDDITTGEPRQRQKEHSFVFPAVRDGRIDFYWAGGKLFSYEQKAGFSTHHKYASVLVGNSGDYVSESSLKNGTIRLISDFSEKYDRIKENCGSHSKQEALGVSSIYERFSCARKDASSVVVLDIEASFAKDESQEKDRIDMVSLDFESGMIRFIEAKHYSYRTALRTLTGSPAVVGQLQRYAEQIEKKKAEILVGYKNHVRIINTLFSVNIPEPVDVDHKPILLIFGFDKEQREYLNKNIIEPMEKDELRVYGIGEIKKSDLSVVFRGGKKNWI